VNDKGVHPRHELVTDHPVPARHHAPSARPKRAIQNPPVLDLGEVDDAVRLDLHVFGVHGLEQHRRGVRVEGSGGDPVEGAAPVHGLGAVFADKRAFGKGWVKGGGDGEGRCL
jgi:hypothetical protein